MALKLGDSYESPLHARRNGTGTISVLQRQLRVSLDTAPGSGRSNHALSASTAPSALPTCSSLGTLIPLAPRTPRSRSLSKSLDEGAITPWTGTRSSALGGFPHKPRTWPALLKRGRDDAPAPPAPSWPGEDFTMILRPRVIPIWNSRPSATLEPVPSLDNRATTGRPGFVPQPDPVPPAKGHGSARGSLH